MTVEIKDFTKLQRKFNNLSDLEDELEKTTDKAVKFTLGEIPSNPPKSVRRGFQSAKQRRWFFAALRSGAIEVPYRRTGTIGRTNFGEVRKLGNDIAGVIGNNTVYAPWVISSEKIGNRGPQAKFHKGWYTLQGVVQKAKDGIIKIYEDWIEGLLN